MSRLRGDGGRNGFGVLVAQVAAFARVRVEAANGDVGRVDAVL